MMSRLKLHSTCAFCVSFLLATFPLSAAAAPADAAASKASSEGLPQFDITTFPSQMFWLFVSFIILYIFFSKKTLPQLSSVMERRRNLIESELQTAENKRRETEKLKNNYDASIRESVAKAKETIAKAKQNALDASEKAAADFQAKSEKESLMTTVKANEAKQEALHDLHTISAEVAAVAVEKITGINITQKDALAIITKKNSPKAKAA